MDDEAGAAKPPLYYCARRIACGEVNYLISIFANDPMLKSATLSFAHTLSPSAKTTNQLVLSLMGSLTPEGRQLVLKGLGAQ